MRGIETPLADINQLSNATNQLLVCEQEKRGDTTKTAVTPLTYSSVALFSTDDDITAGSAQTPDDDLSDVLNVVKIQVTLVNSPTLSNTATPGTVEITGTDSGGATQSETLSFENAALATPQTTDAYFATVTGVTYAGFSAGDARIEGLDCRQGNFGIQWLVPSTDLAAEGAAIEAPYYTGKAVMTKGIAGPYTVSSGMEMLLSGARGTALLWAALMQDPSPDWHILGGSGQTLPAEVTVVAAGALDGSPAMTIADNLSSTTNPVKLSATLSGSPTLAAGSIFGTVKITGTDHGGEVLESVLSWTSSTLTQTTKETEYYFASVTSVVAAGFSQGTVAVTGQDEAVEITFRSNDDVIRRLLQFEIAKGIVPNMYWDCVINELTIDIPDRETALRAAITFLGGRVALRQNIAGTTGAGARKTELPSTVPFASTDFIPSWGASVQIDGVDFAITNASLAISQNLADSGVISKQRYTPTNPVRSKRSVVLSGEILYSPEIDISSIFLNNQTVPNVRIVLNNSVYGGFPVAPRIELPTGYFEGFGDPATGEDGLIGQSFSLRSFDGVIGGVPNDFYIVAQYAKYDRIIEWAA